MCLFLNETYAYVVTEKFEYGFKKWTLDVSDDDEMQGNIDAFVALFPSYNQDSVRKELMSCRYAWKRIEGKDNQEILEKLTKLTFLRSLKLTGPVEVEVNERFTVPSEIFNLIELEVLDLSNMGGIEFIPGDIAKLKALHTLNIAHTYYLESLPGDFAQLKHFKKLEMYGSAVETLPVLPHLEVLDLSGSHHTIKKLLPSIAGLTHLKELDLSGNNLEALPDLSALVKLEKVKFSGNKLEVFPEALLGFEALKDLDLSNNKAINEIPAGIGGLTHLKRLNLSQTGISALPLEIANLENLKRLILSNTDLSALPENIGSLKTLNYLDLSNTPLKVLPATIKGLENLQGLNLSETALEVLPAEIGALQELTYLSLSGTKIREVPVEIGSLTKLYSLHLGYNSALNVLPRSLANLAISNGGRLLELTLGRAPISINGDSLSLQDVYMIFNPVVMENGEPVLDREGQPKRKNVATHDAFGPYFLDDEVEAKDLGAVIEVYQASYPRFDLDAFKDLKLNTVPVTSLDYEGVRTLFDAVLGKVSIDAAHYQKPGYFSALTVNEYFGEGFEHYEKYLTLARKQERSDEEDEQLKDLEKQYDAYIAVESEAKVNEYKKDVLHKLRSLWGALNEGEATAWVVKEAAQKQAFKNNIVYILETLQGMERDDIPGILAQFIKGMLYCPVGQNTALLTIVNGFLGNAVGDDESFENKVKRIAAFQKEHFASIVFNPSGNTQSVHFLEYYKHQLQSNFGFSNVDASFKDSNIRTLEEGWMGTDIFGRHPANAAEAYLQRVTPMMIARKLLSELKVDDVLAYLMRAQKIKEDDGEDLENTTYEGSEVYFDKPYTMHYDTSTGAYKFSDVRLTKEGALQLLIDLGIALKEAPKGEKLIEAN